MRQKLTLIALNLFIFSQTFAQKQNSFSSNLSLWENSVQHQNIQFVPYQNMDDSFKEKELTENEVTVIKPLVVSPRGGEGDPAFYIEGGGASHSSSPFGKPNFTFGIGLEIRNQHKHSFLIGANLDYRAKYSSLSNISINHLKFPIHHKVNFTKNFGIKYGLTGNYITSIRVGNKNVTDWDAIQKGTDRVRSKKGVLYNDRASVNATFGIEAGILDDVGPVIVVTGSYCLTEGILHGNSLFQIDAGLRFKMSRSKKNNK